MDNYTIGKNYNTGFSAVNLGSLPKHHSVMVVPGTANGAFAFKMLLMDNKTESTGITMNFVASTTPVVLPIRVSSLTSLTGAGATIVLLN
jgi:hypothetical protein